MTETKVFSTLPARDIHRSAVRNGARALLSQAVEAEVAALLDCHAEKLTDDGHQRLVRHGHLSQREIMTDQRERGAGIFHAGVGPANGDSWVSSVAWSIFKPPSTASSRTPTNIPNPLSGPQTQTKSSPLSDVGIKC